MQRTNRQDPKKNNKWQKKTKDITKWLKEGMFDVALCKKEKKEKKPWHCSKKDRGYLLKNTRQARKILRDADKDAKKKKRCQPNYTRRRSVPNT